VISFKGSNSTQWHLHRNFILSLLAIEQRDPHAAGRVAILTGMIMILIESWGVVS